VTRPLPASVARVPDSLLDEVRRVWRRAALRFGRWPRRLLAIGCLTLAAVSAIDAAQAEQGRTRIVIAARDLPAGAPIRPGQVASVLWPARLVTRHALHRLAEASGRVPVAAIAVGEPVTETRLVGADLAVGLPAGTVVATVAVADAAASTVLHPGDHADLVRPATSDGDGTAGLPAVVLARDVTVLAVFTADSAQAAVSIAVAVDEATALRLSGSIGVPLVATVRPR
jgi:pilus assembly protein CpaB